ncbi:MAG: SDR family NAD(P)-dependent oxidoreductase [Aliishimia sp.]
MQAPKTALVTGANRGLGRAIALGLRSDHRVVIGVRNPDEGAAVAAEMGVEWVHLDLEDPETFASALHQIAGVDVLVNNAGVLIDAPIMQDPIGFETSMQVMLHAPFHLIGACVPHMKSVGWGRIVNVSSDWGSFANGLEGPGAYGIAKAALNALTHTLPRDLPPYVKVNACCPGWLQTRMGGPAATRSPKEGAETPLWLARLPDDGPTGGFFRDKQVMEW